MLGLTLREEFRGRRLKGTAIELSNDNQTGATQIAAAQFLEITYLTEKGIKAARAPSLPEALQLAAGLLPVEEPKAPPKLVATANALRVIEELRAHPKNQPTTF